MKRLILSISLLAFCNWSFAQEVSLPAPSPSTEIMQEFSTSSITLKYSRPSLKGRKMFGSQIPYGEVWRTGANNTTTLSFKEPIKWGDDIVPPGTYGFVTIPNKNEWVFLLHKNTEAWGVDGLSEDGYVAKAAVPIKKQENTQETFEISFQNITNSTVELVLRWENIEASLNLKTDNRERILEQIAVELKGDNPPYLPAARIYLEFDYRLEEALNFVEKAIKENPNAFYMHWTKAQILEKLGKKEEAINSARKAFEGAKGSAYESEYKHHYNNLKSKI